MGSELSCLKVISISDSLITFENGFKLFSVHDTECCEAHFLDFSQLTLSDFEGLSFDLSGSSFFKGIENYGLELLPISGWGVKIPAYGYNNGYYSDALTLVLGACDGNIINMFDITKFQDVYGE